MPEPRRDELTKRNRPLATSPIIDHTLVANDFFTDPLGHARTHPGTALRRWWSQDQCNRPGAFGPLLLARVRPDRHGIWVDGDRILLFFLEHDTGTEPLGRLVEKLERYSGTPDNPKLRLPVLFWLHSAVREYHLHCRLAKLRFPMLVATAARDHAAEVGASPAGAIWSEPGWSGPRCSLAELGADYDPKGLAELLGETADQHEYFSE